MRSAQTPDRKPGRELASRAEGFFCLDFLLLFYQEKSSSPAAMSGTEYHFKTRTSLLRNEAYASANYITDSSLHSE